MYTGSQYSNNNQELPIMILFQNQVDTLDKNAKDFKVEYYPVDTKNGIIHVVGPENGLSLPGMTIVCGDSHTTHGAIGAIAFGISTSEVEMVLSVCFSITSETMY